MFVDVYFRSHTFVHLLVRSLAHLKVGGKLDFMSWRLGLGHYADTPETRLQKSLDNNQFYKNLQVVHATPNKGPLP
jgi:hypothetical protein